MLQDLKSYVIYGETIDILGIYKPEDFAEYTNRMIRVFNADMNGMIL